MPRLPVTASGPLSWGRDIELSLAGGQMQRVFTCGSEQRALGGRLGRVIRPSLFAHWCLSRNGEKISTTKEQKCSKEGKEPTSRRNLLAVVGKGRKLCFNHNKKKKKKKPM